MEQGFPLMTFLKRNWIILAVGGLGLICILVGIIQFLIPHSEKVVFEKGSEGSEKGEVAGASDSQISIDVEGAVERAGVYKVSSSARIQDALIAAGGVSGDADREYLSKHINLAQKLSDGSKIYIPKLGEQVSTSTSSSDTSSQNGLVNINTASSSELDSLPGIGSVTAEKIISGRPYTSLDELTSKKVISASVFSKIKDKIGL